MKLFALAALLLLSTTAVAQTSPPWDRGITSARVIPLNGLPPGTRYQLRVEWFANTNNVAPLPLDLSSELRVMLNGALISSATHTELLTQTGTGPGGGSCDGGANGYCNPTPCAYYNGTPGGLEGKCYHPVDLGCDCGLVLGNHLTLPGITLQFGDVITVVVVPTAAAAGEIRTSNDAFSFVYADDPFTPECSGHGVLATPCPCANYGLAGRGCANSITALGALLEASGSTDADPITGTDSVVLHGSNMPATATAIYLKGDAYDSSGVAFGDGLLCASGSLIRLRTKFNVAGASSFPEPGDPSLSVRGQTPPGSGLIGHYQIYYRNAASYCTTATFNVTNGMRIDW